MKLIFIRHGEPEYEHDGLTEKGQQEAQLLAQRVKNWPVKDIYVSCLGRARATAEPSLKILGREATAVCDWMKEFCYPVTDPTTGRHGVPWDFMPEYFTKETLIYDKDRWAEAEVYKQNTEIPGAYENVCRSFDELMAGYGYKRIENEGGGYYDPSGADPGDEDQALVFFCHLGLTCVIMSHLMGISPALLWHGLYLAPTSVTVFNCEKRREGSAWFRAQVIGDTAHLRVAGEPVSTMGAFSSVFDK